ncbi:VOC family protein [Actinomadura rayongensis]|uniref:VOC family protein n=1 Tax=Actinomadura rayongensis TaxID=1429076 RepID=UPI0013706ADB
MIRLVRDVVDYDATRTFYREFGLTETTPGTFASAVGGEQLELRPAEVPAVVRIDIAVEQDSDLDDIAARLLRLGAAPVRTKTHLEAREPVSGVLVRLLVEDRLARDAPRRQTELRRDDLVPHEPVRPQRLGHVVLGCADVEEAKHFFLDGIGMRLSDYVTSGPFMRFDTDHHNIVLIPAPFTLLHHTAWKVRSVDEIGNGGSQMIANHPHRHAWGLGRHAASANYFWYLRDPSGAFAEYYYSDMDERAPDRFFWDRLPDQPELPVAVWASPSLEQAPLAAPLRGVPTVPEEMPAPLLETHPGPSGR